MKVALYFTLTVLLAATSAAQVVSVPAKKVDPVATAVADTTAMRTALTTANTLAKSDNVVAAEAALVAINKAMANTAEWHVESAQRLLQAAEQLARETQAKNIPALIASALAHLTQAEILAKDNAGRATAKTLAGFIHERYRADPAAALASYQLAAELLPAGTKSQAREAADRLTKSDATLHAKGVPTK